jgi:hypothetical protein
VKKFFYLTAICIFSLLLGYQTNHFECPPPQSNGTTEEQSNSMATMLDQGWDGSEQACFYETSQGSQLIPFSWMLALEQPDNSDHFLSDEHVENLGFLARGFDLGNREYDPIQVGFPITQPNAKFTFNVKDSNGNPIQGNSNLGHSGPKYGTNLSESEKWSIIEFMKTEMNLSE